MSFYWRIAISFVVLVAVVLLGQGVMVSYLSESRGLFAPGNPNAVAAAVATDVGHGLEQDPHFDIGAYVRGREQGPGPATYVLTREGRVVTNAARPLSEAIRRQTASMLAGTPLDAGGEPTGPVVSAPIQVRGQLAGMVILPPPPRRGMLANVGELLSLPGTLILIASAALAAIVIFAPARQRLHALEHAARRLGTGELDARAPADGRDEIARVASAFNRMADDLAARTDALLRSNQLRRQMLADISHELRTPLTTIRGYLDTLDMPAIVTDDDKRRRYLETVRGETGRLERIVLDLLDLARFENNAASLAPRVFDIERLFDAVTRRFEHEAALAGVTIRSAVAGGADQLSADPDRLDQALSNLVANALRHTPRGGTIALDARLSGGSRDMAYRIEVADSGGGIDVEHLEHIFDRFYKVDPARAAGTGGSGLGLSIVKAIVERHGGTITVTSEPGQTTFVITLPQAPA